MPQKKKKILIIATRRFNNDGITKVMFDFFENADADKYQVEFACGEESDPSYIKRIENRKGKYYQLPDRVQNKAAYVGALSNLCRKEKYDLVHIHGNSATMFIDVFGAWLGGVKNRVAHSHSTTSEHMRAHKLMKPWFNLLLTQGVACSKAAGDWLYTKPFKVVYNGIDVDKFTYDEKTRLALRRKYNCENDYVIGHIGRFSYQKNQEYVVSLFADLLEKDKKCKLLLIGKGDTYDMVWRIVKEKDIEDHIIYIDASSEINKLMQAMDVFILPSRFEGLPIVAIEAQAASLPCVLSDVITEETKVIDNCRFVSLKSKETWVNTILSEDIKSARRNENDVNRVKQAGFDIKSINKSITYIWGDI